MWSTSVGKDSTLLSCPGTASGDGEGIHAVERAGSRAGRGDDN